MSKVTTAEVLSAVSLHSGKSLWGFQVVADRVRNLNDKLSTGRKVGTIVNPSLPALLREVADLLETLPEPSLEGLAEHLKASL